MRIFFLLILIILLFSCSREKTYEFIVENNTTYKIDFMQLGSSGLEVPPNSRSESVFVNYKLPWGFAMSEPLLSVGVKKYSDSTQTYDNKYGRVISISRLEEDATNLITLELDSPARYENDIFRINLVD